MKNLRDRWGAIHSLTLLLGILMIGAALALLWDAQRPHPVAPAAIHVLQHDNPFPATGVCPGDTITTTVHFRFDMPMVVAIYRSVLDDQGRTVPGAQDELPIRLYPQASETVEQGVWTVPALVPGSYTRVTAFTSHVTETQPEFLVMPFTVRHDCP